MTFESLLATFSTLAGASALIALLVNVLKALGVVQDGTAPVWSAGFNLLALIGLYLFQVVQPEFDPAAVDAVLAQVAQIGAAILALAMQLWGSKLTHAAVRGIPLLGTSFSQLR